MENHFYHIRLSPLNVTIFITHVRRLRNGSYASGVCTLFIFKLKITAFFLQTNGTIVWRCHLGKPIFSSPYVSSCGILVGCVDSYLYCFDHSGTMVSAKGENCCTQELLSPSISSHGILVGCVDSSDACIVLITQDQW